MFIMAVQYRDDEHNRFVVMQLENPKQWDQFLAANLPEAICGYLVEKADDLRPIPRLQVQKFYRMYRPGEDLPRADQVNAWGLLAPNAVSFEQGLETLVRLPAERKKIMAKAQKVEGEVTENTENTENGAATEAAAPKAPRVKKDLRAVPEFNDETKIKLLVTENPRRPGSATYEIFNHYSDGITVGDFVKAGGRRVDVKADYERGHIDFAS